MRRTPAVPHHQAWAATGGCARAARYPPAPRAAHVHACTWPMKGGVATSAQTHERRSDPALWWCAWAAAAAVLLVRFLLELSGGPAAAIPDDRRVTASPSARDSFTGGDADVLDMADSGQRWVHVASA